jgi:hypothetical protein
MERMDPILTYALIAILIALIVEAIASAMWLRIYYQHGLPIFRRSYPGITPKELDVLVATASAELDKGWLSPIVFEMFHPIEWAFREKLIDSSDIKLFNYPPIMRGLIRLDEGQNTLIVTGYLNWYILSFPLFLSIFSFNVDCLVPCKWSGMYLLIPPFLLIMLGLYFLQATRYNRIGQILSKQI